MLPRALLLMLLPGAAAFGREGRRVFVSATRARAPTCSVPYYTKREAQQLQRAQHAAVRTIGGVLGGAAWRLAADGEACQRAHQW